MNKKYLLLILVVVGAILIIARREDSGPLTKSLPAELAPMEEVKPQPSASAVSETPVAPAGEDSSVPRGIEVRHFQELGQCLKIKNTIPGQAAPGFADIQSSVRNELGDVMVAETDWKNVHVKLSNGEQRRLRIEVEGAGEELAIRKLKYYTLDNEGLPLERPLTKEQSVNPTETFIASLEHEGAVTLKEEAKRGAFSSGADLYYVERNGQLSELEMSYKGQSFKCSDLNNSRSKCRCF